jgi:hypothetical protein
VDVDPEDELVAFGPRDVEEPEEEADQRRIAVNESDPVAAAVRLVLNPFAPVGDGAGDEDLPVAQLADLGCRGGADGFPSGLAQRALDCPVPADALG